MSRIIREQDILKLSPPNDVGFWSEEAIRKYQESNGIDYGKSVFVRGVEPHREWSNDRYFGNTVQQINTSSLRGGSENSEIEELKATIKWLEEMIADMAAVQHPPQPTILPPTSKGLDRQGLLHPSTMDKRTKEYKQWAAANKQA